LSMCAEPAGRGRLACCSVVHTAAVEDYLKAIFELVTRRDVATTSLLAERLGVAAPSASVMVRRLTEGGLVVRPGEHRIELTEHGTQHAVDVVRRHRLIEEFLVKVLDVPWEDVHGEAEVLEHAVSSRLLEHIDALLGHPTHDPHGDPIPPADGSGHVERWTTPLSAAPVGVSFTVERVLDRDRTALRYLGDLGIRPGVVLDVVEQAPFGGPLWVRLDGRSLALGDVLAGLVFGAPS
jgi:DtxR family transcriptional regulator, Mn-dependent transcriptional regulator